MRAFSLIVLRRAPPDILQQGDQGRRRDPGDPGAPVRSGDRGGEVPLADASRPATAHEEPGPERLRQDQLVARACAAWS